MIESEKDALELVRTISAKEVMFENYNPDGMTDEVYKAWKESNKKIQILTTDYFCDYPDVKIFLYSIVTGESKARELENAKFYAMYALARDCISDPNIQTLIRSIYANSPDSDLGQDARGHLIRAGISFDDVKGMSVDEIPKKVGKSIDKGASWFEGVLAIGGGIALPIFAWSKRPLDLRDLSETALISLQNEWVFKPLFFYGSFVITVALIVFGIGKLRSLE